jgi:hypothetical protein
MAVAVDQCQSRRKTLIFCGVWRHVVGRSASRYSTGTCGASFRGVCGHHPTLPRCLCAGPQVPGRYGPGAEIISVRGSLKAAGLRATGCGGNFPRGVAIGGGTGTGWCKKWPPQLPPPKKRCSEVPNSVTAPSSASVVSVGA